MTLNSRRESCRRRGPWGVTYKTGNRDALHTSPGRDCGAASIEQFLDALADLAVRDDLAQGLPDTSGGVTMLLFADAISITVHQVRACALDEASNRGRTDLVEWLLSQPVMTHEPGKLRNTVGYVAPLSLIGLQMPQVKGVASYGRAYEHWLSSGSIGAGPSGPILAELAFAHRRFRSIRFAERAFRKEASTLGPDFSPQRLLAREVWYVYCAEIAGLEAAWSESDGARNAAAIASTAIRSPPTSRAIDARSSVVVTTFSFP